MLFSGLLLWLIFAAVTGAVIWALLRPLKAARGTRDGGGEVALYRDQLSELTRDLERGLIGETEAEAARIEISRRLLAAADAAERENIAPSAAPGSRRLAIAVIAVALPIFSLVLYVTLGSPQLPDVPFAARIAKPVDQLPIDALVLKVEQHLKDDPRDLRGWEVLAPAYMRQSRYGDAADAWSRAIALGGETAMRFAARGEAEVMAANGMVAPDAKADFTRAEALDAHEPRSQFYLGLADAEDGKKDAAAKRWKALLATAPKDAPWRASVEAELAALSNADAPGPTPDQAGAAAGMAPEARTQMIEGMVGKLAARLDASPNDIEGWLRLIRSYGVLGKPAEARAALARARKVFAGDRAALARLDDAEKSLPQ
ncbi:MAG TPA: c-type cytochrome biogenesis protein CcmI [Parvibaculum sp.]